MNNTNDTNNYVISLTNSSSNSALNTAASTSHQGSVESVYSGKPNERCLLTPADSVAAAGSQNPSTSAHHPSMTASLPHLQTNQSEIDYASLLININANDYMLPPINLSNNTNLSGQQLGAGISSSYSHNNYSANLANWDWSTFNSGMVSAASVDCSGGAAGLNSVHSDPTTINNTVGGSNGLNHYNNGAMYQMKNLTNFISTIGATNSKGYPLVNPTLPKHNMFASNLNPTTATFRGSRGGDGNIASLNQNPNSDANGNPAAAGYPLQQNGAPMSRQSSNLSQIDALVSMLSGNVSKIANYEVDAQRAFNCLPQAISLLNNGPDNEASRAAYLIYLLSKKEACRYVLCGNVGLCGSLVSAIVRLQHNQSVVRYCTAIVYHLINSDLFINHYIGTPGAIKVICELTVSPMEATAFYAVATVHTMLVKFPELRNQVLDTKCFEKIVPLLKMKNPKFVTLVADVLHFLSIGNLPILMNALNTDLHAQLVHLLKTNQFEKLLFTVCRFVKSLSTNNASKVALLQHNVMGVLTELLLNKSRRIACTSLWALRNFSDSCGNDQNFKDLLVICTRFIHVQISDQSTTNFDNSSAANDERVEQCGNGSRQSRPLSEPSLVACAVGILANLTCNNQDNKETLVKSGGLEALIALCSNALSHKEIIEPTMYVLRNITSQHKFVDHAIATMKSLNCFQFLSNCLNLLFNDSADDFFPQLKKATMSVISNVIINNESSLNEFFSLQVTQKTTNVLRYSIEMIKQFYTLTNDAGKEPTKELAKQLQLYNKLIEDSIILMFIFVGSCGGRNSYEIISTIVTNEFLDCLTQLLFSEDAGVLSCVIGILSTVSRTSNGMTLIYNKYFATSAQNLPPSSIGGGESIGKIVMNQLAAIVNSNSLDDSIKSATQSLISNWTNYLNSNSSATLFSSSQPNTTTNSAMQNLNSLGLGIGVGIGMNQSTTPQHSPYTQQLGRNTPTHQHYPLHSSTQTTFDSNPQRPNFYTSNDNSRTNELNSFTNQPFPGNN